MESSIGEDGNEIIRRQFIQSANCLENYLAILGMIEGSVKELDFSKFVGKVSALQSDSIEAEKRFFFLENRVKMVTDMVAKRFQQLDRASRRKAPVMVRKNPLLDKRDERHNKMTAKLVDRTPSNM